MFIDLLTKAIHEVFLSIENKWVTLEKMSQQCNFRENLRLTIHESRGLSRLIGSMYIYIHYIYVFTDLAVDHLSLRVLRMDITSGERL